MTRTLPLFLAALLVADPAHAADKITEQMIRDYYKTTAAAFRLPYTSYKQAVETMLADTYKSTANITLVIPGKAKTQRTESLTKGQTLAISPQTYEAMKPATINYNIKTIEIAPDGKTAKVADALSVTGMVMPGLPVTMSNTGTCNETFYLNTAGKLQMTSSACTIQTVMLPKFR